MAEEILVLVTCPSAESEKLAVTLVEERLAACVNIIDGARSIYLWQGKLCNEPEQLLIIKSTRAAWKQLEQKVRSLHSYAVPEIVSLSIDNGHGPYLQWLNASVKSTDPNSEGQFHG